MLPLSRRVLVVAVAGTAVLAPAGAASAATLALSDPSGDVWSQAMSGTGPSGSWSAAGTRVNTDLRRTSFRHGPANLVVRARFADLRRVGGGYEFGFELRTNEGQHRFAVVIAGPGGWHGQLIVGRRNGSFSCKAASKQIDYDMNTVTVTFPRSCAGNPRWVQLNAGVYSFDKAMTSIYADNPHNDQATFRGWSERVRKG